MTGKLIKIVEMKDDGDHRGFSYNLPGIAFEHIGEIKDIHCAQILSNKIRGNHYHIERQEIIQVFYEGDWTLGYQSTDENTPSYQRFSGQGSVLIFISPYVSHAIRNDGVKPLLIIAYSSRIYQPDDTDSYSSIVLPVEIPE
jgi:dTDP-4-dehydrorhamnose 3,5-epimerase